MKVKYKDHMGGDLRVAEAARVSFAEEVEQFGDSEVRLIKYLAKHNHWTPFAHPQVTLIMQAPTPIRTQCFKSKIGFTENEESRRYISHEPEFFMPREFRGKPTDGAKQGSAGVLEGPTHTFMEHVFKRNYSNALHDYKLVMEYGLCPEQARFLLPQGMEVNWYWTGSLAAFARFAKQRMDPHAQGEVQDLAREVSAIMGPLYPVSWPLLMGDDVTPKQLEDAIKETL
jgi:thymidylate synthase (FAD)